MTRLIDADELAEIINWTFAKPPFSRKTVQKMIDMARTIDAVPVIRCKDCAYYSILGECYYLLTNFEMDNDDYCSNAKPKEDS